MTSVGAGARAAVLVTGDEVLGGRVAEQNAAFIARRLAAHGLPVECTVIVGDRTTTISSAIRRFVAEGYELVCVTGGLGPTYDDMTMQAVADAVGVPLQLDEQALEFVHRRSAGLRAQLHVDDGDLEAMRRKQAMLPRGATVLPPIGTAPGCAVHSGATLVVVLPGPPNEAHPMWQAAVAAGPLADLLARVPPRPTRTIRLWGVVEAELMGVLNHLPEHDLARIGTYTRTGELEIVTPPQLADDVADRLAHAFPGAVFARDGAEVDQLIAGWLIERGERLAVAESCTGGGLGARLTARPGASEWFAGGVIAYANEVKEHVLGVPAQVLATHGAVSGECAAGMAQGVRRATGAEWGVSITGVAGPDGGTPDKPVGLVWIGVAGPAVVRTVEHRFWTRDREGVRLRAQTAALHAVRLTLTRP